MPPRKKNWKPGAYQIGVFIRTGNGSVLETVADDATEKAALAVQSAFLDGTRKGAKK